MCARHCSVEFMKQVLPKFPSPVGRVRRRFFRVVLVAVSSVEEDGGGDGGGGRTMIADDGPAAPSSSSSVVSNPIIVFPTTSSADSGEGIGNFVCVFVVSFSNRFFSRHFDFQCFGG